MTGLVTMGNAAAAVLDAGAINTGRISVSEPDDSLYVHGGQLFIDAGNRNAAQVFSTSGQSPAGWFQNTVELPAKLPDPRQPPVP